MTEDPAGDFRRELRHWREVKGLTRKGLSEEMLFDPSYVGKVESGTAPSEAFVREADRILQAGGMIVRRWQAELAARSRLGPVRQPRLPAPVDMMVPPSAGLVVEHEHAELTLADGIYRTLHRRRIRNVGTEPVTRYHIRISVDRFPEDQARSDELYRRRRLDMTELQLFARAGANEMTPDVSLDRRSLMEVWLLFANDKGRFHFPLYPGESTRLEYGYVVDEERWGDWFQRAVRLPTGRLSVRLVLPAERDPKVSGTVTSMTAEASPFRTPITHEELDGNRVFSWAIDNPPLHARYRLEWKFRAMGRAAAAQPVHLRPCERMTVIGIAQRGDPVLEGDLAPCVPPGLSTGAGAGGDARGAPVDGADKTSDPPPRVLPVLEEMRISGLGVIDDAVLELAPGLTVVSGETGAGKTMVVQGLGLLAGGRADSGLVRPGCERAFVEGRLVVDPAGPVAARALEAGAELDDGVLLVGRTVTAKGGSRAHVGGRSVPAGVLAELADGMLAVHGQSDQQRLLRPAEQRAALDRFAGEPVAKPLGQYGEAYRRLGEVTRDLAERTERARERAQEAELLRLGLAEVERVEPASGEDAALDAELDRLQNAETLAAAATSTHATLTGEESADGEAGALDLVSTGRRTLAQASGYDPRLAALGGRLDEVGMLLADVAADLASYAAGVEFDPARLAAAQDRKAALTSLTRAHATDIDGVLAWADRAGRRLLELDGDGGAVAELSAERDRLLTRLGTLAGKVSAARRKAAGRFAAAVGTELASLAMPRAEVRADVNQRESADGLVVGERGLAYGPTGVDDVELLLVPHPGAPARPLQKGASGGELSRVMLAVEVVFAAADTTPTLVFDEVDAGVGGRAAVEVGRRLARLATTHQVLCVTHLPQVAAFADRHLVVTKSDDGRVTRSGVVALDAEGRVRELSRMLAGLDSSALARGHAEELLAAAAQAKAS